MTNNLEYSVLVFNTEIAHVKTGYVRIFSKEKLYIKKINGAIYTELKGNLSPDKTHVMNFDVESPIKIQSHEVHKIPFTFNLQEIRQTYHGKNASFLYKCEIKLFLDENEIKKLKLPASTKLKSILLGEYVFKTQTYFETKSSVLNYQVKEEILDFEFRNDSFNSGFLFIISVFLFCLNLGIRNTTYLIITSVLVLFVLGLGKFSKLIQKSLLRSNISIQILKKDIDSFSAQLRLAHNIPIRYFSIHYEVIEQVIDDRGSSTAKYEVSLFKSNEISWSKEHLPPALVFNLPEKKGLEPLTEKNFSIIWRMFLTIRLPFQFEISYTVDFKVN